MRKTGLFIGLIMISAVAVVVASPRKESHQVKQSFIFSEGNTEYTLVKPVYLVCNFDHAVPMVQGGSLFHIETVAFHQQIYSSRTMVKIRGPTTEKLNLIPFIRDKTGS